MKKWMEYLQAIVIAVMLVVMVVAIFDFYQEKSECEAQGKVMLRAATGYVCVRLEK